MRAASRLVSSCLWLSSVAYLPPSCQGGVPKNRIQADSPVALNKCGTVQPPHNQESLQVARFSAAGIVCQAATIIFCVLRKWLDQGFPSRDVRQELWWLYRQIQETGAICKCKSRGLIWDWRNYDISLKAATHFTLRITVYCYLKRSLLCVQRTRLISMSSSFGLAQNSNTDTRVHFTWHASNMILFFVLFWTRFDQSS